MNLKYSDVAYNGDEHTYTRPDGKRLSGITGMIDRQIFGGKFANMDKEFLRPYAEKGKLVHNEIESYYTVGISPTTEEAQAFAFWGVDNLLITNLATEYTVTDNENFATNIDLVEHDGWGNYYLYDFKTSSILDLDSLSWQLSICAELFNIQNGFYPAKLFGVHLRGNVCNVVEIERKPTESVLRLLEAEIQGQRYIQPTSDEKTQLARLNDVLMEIKAIKQQADEAEERKAVLLEGLERVMAEKGLKSLKTDLMTITKVEPTQAVTIDTKAMKLEYPEICKKFERVTEKKGFVKITLAKEP